jgi:hypothetical protein
VLNWQSKRSPPNKCEARERIRPASLRADDVSALSGKPEVISADTIHAITSGWPTARKYYRSREP